MLVLLMFGCSGSGTVEVDGVDAFGAVWSAWWYEGAPVDQLYLLGDGVYGAGEAVLESGLSLSTAPGECGRKREYFEGWEENSEALADAAEEGEDAACAAVPDFLRAQAELRNRLYGSPRNVLSVSFCVWDEEGDACAMPEGTWSLDGGEEHHVWATLRYGEGETADPDDAADAWDVDACDWKGGGSDEDDEDEAWGIAGGELDLASIEEEGPLEGSLEGDLVDYDDYREAEEDGRAALDDEGSLRAEFRAEWCELPELDVLVL